MTNKLRNYGIIATLVGSTTICSGSMALLAHTAIEAEEQRIKLRMDRAITTQLLPEGYRSQDTFTPSKAGELLSSEPCNNNLVSRLRDGVHLDLASEGLTEEYIVTTFKANCAEEIAADVAALDVNTASFRSTCDTVSRVGGSDAYHRNLCQVTLDQAPETIPRKWTDAISGLVQEFEGIEEKKQSYERVVDNQEGLATPREQDALSELSRLDWTYKQVRFGNSGWLPQRIGSAIDNKWVADDEVYVQLLVDSGNYVRGLEVCAGDYPAGARAQGCRSHHREAVGRTFSKLQRARHFSGGKVAEIRSYLPRGNGRSELSEIRRDEIEARIK